MDVETVSSRASLRTFSTSLKTVQEQLQQLVQELLQQLLFEFEALA